MRGGRLREVVAKGGSTVFSWSVIIKRQYLGVELLV